MEYAFNIILNMLSDAKRISAEKVVRVLKISQHQFIY